LIETLESGLTKDYAAHKKDNAMGLTVSDADDALKKVHTNAPRAAIALWLLTMCGCRNSCLMKLSYRDMAVFTEGEGDIEWSKEELWITLRTGKNRGKPQDKHLCVEEVAHNLVAPPGGWSGFQQEVKIKAKTHPNGKPFGDQSTSKVLEALRQAGLRITTYHFRKHFTARVYAETGDKDKVARRMGHRVAKNAEAFYMGPEMKPVVDEYKKHFARLRKKTKQEEKDAEKAEASAAKAEKKAAAIAAKAEAIAAKDEKKAAEAKAKTAAKTAAKTTGAKRDAAASKDGPAKKKPRTQE
jgi:ribosomal protein L9